MKANYYGRGVIVGLIGGVFAPFAWYAGAWVYYFVYAPLLLVNVYVWWPKEDNGG